MINTLNKFRVLKKLITLFIVHLNIEVFINIVTIEYLPKLNHGQVLLTVVSVLGKFEVTILKCITIKLFN